MLEKKTNAGQGFGIAGLILGIIAFLIAFIPCIGVMALVPGALAVTFSIIGLVQANRNNGSRDLIIAALIVSIIGTLIAGAWALFFSTLKDFNKQEFETRIEETIGDEEEFKEIGRELEKALEELEGVDSISQRWDKDMDEEDFNMLLEEYEALIQEFIRLTEKAESGNISAITSFSKVSVRAAKLGAKLSRVEGKLTPEQEKRFEDLHEKYKDALDRVEE